MSLVFQRSKSEKKYSTKHRINDNHKSPTKQIPSLPNSLQYQQQSYSKIKDDEYIKRQNHVSNNESIEAIIFKCYELGKAISMSLWEIEAFVRECRASNQLSSGYQILEVYYTLQLTINELVIKKMDLLKAFQYSIESNDTSSLHDTCRLLAEYELRIWLNICYIRQLQWTISPISVNIPSGNMYTEPYLSIYLKTSMELCQLINSNSHSEQSTVNNTDINLNNSLIGIMLYHSIPLTCIYLSDKALSKLIQTSDLLLCQDDDDYEAKLSSNLYVYNEFINIYRHLIQYEKQEEDLWKVFKALHNSNSSKDVSPSASLSHAQDCVPMLGLQYDNAFTTNNSNTISNNKEIYYSASNIIENYLVTYYSYTPDSSTMSHFHKALRTLQYVNQSIVSRNSNIKQKEKRSNNNIKNYVYNSASKPLKSVYYPISDNTRHGTAQNSQQLPNIANPNNSTQEYNANTKSNKNSPLWSPSDHSSVKLQQQDSRADQRSNVSPTGTFRANNNNSVGNNRDFQRQDSAANSEPITISPSHHRSEVRPHTSHGPSSSSHHHNNNNNNNNTMDELPKYIPIRQRAISVSSALSDDREFMINANKGHNNTNNITYGATLEEGAGSVASSPDNSIYLANKEANMSPMDIKYNSIDPDIFEDVTSPSPRNKSPFENSSSPVNISANNQVTKYVAPAMINCEKNFDVHIPVLDNCRIPSNCILLNLEQHYICGICRIIVVGYIDGCSTHTMQLIHPGDEIVEVCNQPVIGKSIKELYSIIQAKNIATRNLSVMHVKIKRHYNGWKEFKNGLTLATTSFITSPKSRGKVKSDSNIDTFNRTSPHAMTPNKAQQNRLESIEGAIENKRNEIILAEKLVKNSAIENFIERKEMFLKKVDEMMLLQELLTSCKEKLYQSNSRDASPVMHHYDRPQYRQRDANENISSEKQEERNSRNVTPSRNRVSSASKKVTSATERKSVSASSSGRPSTASAVLNSPTYNEKAISNSRGKMEDQRNALQEGSLGGKSSMSRSRGYSESSTEDYSSMNTSRRTSVEVSRSPRKSVVISEKNNTVNNNPVTTTKNYVDASGKIIITSSDFVETNNGKKKRRRKKSYSRYVPRTLRSSLNDVQVLQGTMSAERLAVMKIGVWWKFIFPRKKLMNRLSIRTFVRNILFSISNKAVDIGYRAQRRRIEMLRDGASTLIQRKYRQWFRDYVSKIYTLQKFFRRCIARKRVLKVVTLFRAMILIYRYCHKWLSRRKTSNTTVLPKRRHLRRVMSYFTAYYGVMEKKKRNYDFHMKLMEKNPNMKNRMLHSNKLIQAAVKIQSVWRGKQGRNLVHDLRYERSMQMRIAVAFFAHRFRRRVARRKRGNDAATMIQKVFRGALTRFQLMVRVYSGIKITNAWRKHKHYKKLKQCLRRIEHPHRIVIHGISNIPTQIINNSSGMTLKVSVWWTPLLHLVEKDDVETVVKSKIPQFEKETVKHDIGETLVPMPVITEEVPVPKPLGPKYKARSSFGSSGMTMRSSSILVKGLAHGPGAGINSLAEFVARQQQLQQRTSMNSHGKVAKRSVSAIMEDGDHDSDSESSNSDSDSSHSSDSEKADAKNTSKLKVDCGSDDDETGSGHKSRGSNYKKDSVNGSLEKHSDADGKSECGEKMLVKGGLLNQSAFFRKPASPDGSQENPGSGVMATLTTMSATVNNLLHTNIFSTANANTNNVTSPPKSLASPTIQTITRNVSNFDDETIYLPGCHGNSVIGFELYNGGNRIAGTIFRLADTSGLMYWGGEKKVNLEIDKYYKNKLLRYDTPPILEARIVSGAPNRTKCGTAYLAVFGTGPLKSKMRTKGFVKSFFTNWDKLYLSLDGENLGFFKKKTALEPYLVLPVNDIKAVRSEISTSKIEGTAQDTMDIIISTTMRDELYIKCEDSLERLLWLGILNECVEYIKKTSQNTLLHLNSNGDMQIVISRRQKSKKIPSKDHH